MSEKERKGGGFWSLFSPKKARDDRDKAPPRRRSRSGDGDGDDDGGGHRRRWSEAPSPPSEPQSPRRQRWSDAKGKGYEPESPASAGPRGPARNRRASRAMPAAAAWPPDDMSSDEELSPSEAKEYVCRGAPVFTGHRRSVAHAADHYYALYSTSSGGPRGETDAANLHDSMTQLMTMRTLGPGPASRPWDSLEQPSFAFHFGRRPGTVTLNHWVSAASTLPPAIALRDSGFAPRDADLELIMWRLQDLERGLEDDDEALMYKNLYRHFLRDPDKLMSPHKTLDRQITDLIRVLSRPDHWIDFTESRNQIATRFIYDTKSANHTQYVRFFHQLLLSSELDLRINSRHHNDQPRDQLLAQLPPTIQWSLALSRRWREYVRIDDYGDTARQVKLRFKLKKRQMKMLKRFAQMMKWPNLAETLDNLEREDAKTGLTNISSHAMAFFSGLVLPGPTFPFLIMNSLIDLDPDRATDELALLTPVHPSCGFQYRNSYTYWTSASIVGKVLAPTCREVGGWVGPARPTSDLGRTQIARIRTRKTRPPPRNQQSPLSDPPTPPTPQELQQQRHRVIPPQDVLSMTTRSDPLCPPSKTYPVREFRMAVPETDSAGLGDIVDTVRIELLTLRRVDRERKPAAPTPATAVDAAPDGTAASAATPVTNGGGTGGGSNNGSSSGGRSGPGVFDASLQFAIDGVSWPLPLNFDVDFVCAWPCTGGPHPLSYEYSFAAIPVDRVVEVQDWAGMYDSGGSDSAKSLSSLRLGAGSATAAATGRNNGSLATFGLPRHQNSLPPPVVRDEKDDEKVLVIEAFTVRDNEVLARAWCARWGISAIVADIKRTCMACAIREAYAATLTVVILMEDHAGEDDYER